MQRALVVGMSLVCFHIGGMAGGRVSPAGGAEERPMIAGAEPARLDPIVVTGT